MPKVSPTFENNSFKYHNFDIFPILKSRYRRILRQLGYVKGSPKEKKRRYFSRKYWEAETEQALAPPTNTLPEEEFTAKNKEFNKILAQNPKNANAWVEYIHHQDRMPMRTTKTQMAEKKIEIIEKALVHNHGNEKLYKLYVEIVDSTYPSFEVSKFLDKLLDKGKFWMKF